MATDHLVFNRLKWFNVADNADNITANGRNFYALPSKIKLTKSAHLWTVMGVNALPSFDIGTVFDVLGAYKNTYNEGGKKRYMVSYSESGDNYILQIGRAHV